MTDNLSIYDIEGLLIIEINNNKQRLFKHLSLEIAWNINDYTDLKLPTDSCVLEVREIFDEKIIAIKYDAGIDLLSFASLKKVIAPEKDFGIWRFLIFAEHISDYLSQFHQYDLFQLAIHPERVAIYKNKIVFLPTLSGVLPIIPEIIKYGNLKWLYFIAPEILRTRGMEIERLKSGDIFSLGRLFKLLLSDLERIPEVDAPEELITSIVEYFNFNLIEPPITLPDKILLLIEKMSAPDPNKRPELKEILQELNIFRSKFSPSSIIQLYIDKNELNEAENTFTKYNNCKSIEVFDDIEADFLFCDLMIMKNPPEFQKAINHLDKIIMLHPENFKLHLKKGDIYSKYKSHSQYILLCLSSYEKACILSEWQPDIQLKLFNASMNLDKLDKRIEAIVNIPYNKRIPYYYLILAKSFLQFGKIDSAWDEIVKFFKIVGYNSEAHMIGLQIAQKLGDPHKLLRWKLEQNAEQIPNLKTAVSIAFQLNNVNDLAKKYLTEAINLKN